MNNIEKLADRFLEKVAQTAQSNMQKTISNAINFLFANAIVMANPQQEQTYQIWKAKADKGILQTNELPIIAANLRSEIIVLERNIEVIQNYLAKFPVE